MKQQSLFPSPTPNLHDYDRVILSSSGGKDSVAMISYVVELADTCDYPRSQVVVAHADLGRVEWEGTMQLAKRQAFSFGLRFACVKRDGLDLLDQVRARGMWPSPKQRYCTSDFKRGPISRLYTSLANEVRHANPAIKTPRILSCMGMRAEESSARAKLVSFEYDERASTGRKHIDAWLPIHDWTQAQVWERIHTHNLEYHPAYDLGMPRLSCCFCIFAPSDALLLAAIHNPELFQEYLEVERETGHTFRQDTSLQNVKDRLDAGEVPRTMNDKWNM
jgi:3'-phosphoadenosine 5'-phosphosulfate sulfotransferase (PAPS reductase)/FAD synthetase